MYFEEIGRTRLFTSEWKIISYYDLAAFREEYLSILRITGKLQQMCNLLTSETPLKSICLSSIAQLDNLEEAIESKNRIIFPPPRQIRSIFLSEWLPNPFLES